MEPRTAVQFVPGVIDASRAVLVELGVILRSYLKDLVLIGGWAPYFLALGVRDRDLLLGLVRVNVLTGSPPTDRATI